MRSLINIACFWLGTYLLSAIVPFLYLFDEMPSPWHPQVIQYFLLGATFPALPATLVAAYCQQKLVTYRDDMTAAVVGPILFAYVLVFVLFAQFVMGINC